MDIQEPFIVCHSNGNQDDDDDDGDDDVGDGDGDGVQHIAKVSQL